ncbi:unnamed protein product, partial [Discosporangium mesarthrocarpum]
QNCDNEHHTYCLKPPLKRVPEGAWFCDGCKDKGANKSSQNTAQARRDLALERERQ